MYQAYKSTNGVMVIVVENGHDDPSSSPERAFVHFTFIWERYASNYSPSSYGQIEGQTGLFSLGMGTGFGEGKLSIETC